jgi:hypothetical protein
MKRFRVNTGLIFASWALMLIFGCHRKKPPIPPEETPPTILSQVPIESTEPQTAGTEQQTPPREQQAENTTPPERHTPPKHPRHLTPKKPAEEPEKPATTEEARNIPPTRVVIQEGSTNPGTGQVSTGAPNDNGSNNQTTTQQLLDVAENNLRNIKRQLSADEKSTVEHIRDYITQSKDATKEGDNVRAHNMALKARLLSDELAKAQ